MGYVQLTLDDWLELKQKIKRELVSVKKSFVRIGYALHRIRDEKLYERDGYKTIGEFAEAEYGLKPSTVSRLIEINQKFSIGGNSEELAPEFEDFGKHQLEEMLQLPESDYEMVRPETNREAIRELKRFNAAEASEEGDFKELVKDMLEKTGLLQDLDKSKTVNQLAELVNPSGNRSYRKGKYFVMMYESGLKIKQTGAGIEEMSWDRFFEIVWEVAEKIAPAQKEIIQESQEPKAQTNQFEREKENGIKTPEQSEPEQLEQKVEKPEEAKKTERPERKVEKPEDLKEVERKPEKNEPTKQKEPEEKAPEALKTPELQKYLEEMKAAYREALKAAEEGHWNTWRAQHNAAEEFAKLMQKNEEEDENQMSLNDYPGIMPERGENE